MELWKAAVDEYRFQLDLNARRSQYHLTLSSAVLGVGAGLVRLEGEDGRPLIAAVFAVGAVFALLAIAATATQHAYYRSARDRVRGLQRDLGLAERGLATTPGMRDERRPWWGRLGKVTTVNYFLLVVFAAIDTAAALAFGVEPVADAWRSLRSIW